MGDGPRGRQDAALGPPQDKRQAAKGSPARKEASKCGDLGGRACVASRASGAAQAAASLKQGELGSAPGARRGLQPPIRGLPGAGRSLKRPQLIDGKRERKLAAWWRTRGGASRPTATRCRPPRTRGSMARPAAAALLRSPRRGAVARGRPRLGAARRASRIGALADMDSLHSDQHRWGRHPPVLLQREERKCAALGPQCTAVIGQGSRRVWVVPSVPVWGTS
ncbi:MAG: hypothetical protein J3K34DRAFT_437258, partial [Monoraphidium minutum]